MDIEEIYTFLINNRGEIRKDLTPDADLFRDLGIDGDDFFELMEEFMKAFQVNMNSYLWYFHHGEEGWNIGSLFSPAPYKQVERIIITPKILLEVAESKVWPINYPDHALKSRNVEMGINWFFLFLPIVVILLILIFN